ncbi:MAG: hypothetical protein ACUVX9_16055 [Anaerolineae bacterium]
MRIWHMTADATREPLRVAPGREVRLTVGTAPIAPDQSVSIRYDVHHLNGTTDRGFASAHWERNQRDTSYWSAIIGPFQDGDRVTYFVEGVQGTERVSLPPVRFGVGPRLYVALLWHQHQPSYVDLASGPAGQFLQPWVRLYALRAYYAMAAASAEFPNLRVTFNLTPVLLMQLDRYVEQGVTDWLQDIALRPLGHISEEDKERLITACLNVDWRLEVLPYPRYLALYERRRQGLPFSEQDLCDLLMWHNLSWFAPEFHQGPVRLVTGEEVSLAPFLRREQGFSQTDLEALMAEERKVLAAVVPLHRRLQDQGLIEVSTSPYYHPILPLLLDTDQASIDRPGACLPGRFCYPEDARAQVERGVADYVRRFGRRPRGMWPAEGAVSADSVPLYLDQGIEWLASDQGVLERSGRYGYEASRADVLCRPYQVRDGRRTLSIFFRHTHLSDLVGFYYHRAFADMDLAAQDFVRRLQHTIADQLTGQEDRIVSIILDGENTLRAYGPRAPQFLRALYRRLSDSSELQTVTFSEYLGGDAARRIHAHPSDGQERIYELYTGSWIDEAGSEPGSDLGTWIGEPDENRAWGLLRQAREALQEMGATPQTHPSAFEALYMAEGSDWFWWLGRDHEMAREAESEAIFRRHLENAYRLAGLEPPPVLGEPLVPWSLEWELEEPVEALRSNERLTVRANCPGTVLYRALPGGEEQEATLEPASAPGALTRRFQATLGPFGAQVREVRLRWRCQHGSDDMSEVCVQPRRPRKKEETWD